MASRRQRTPRSNFHRHVRLRQSSRPSTLQSADISWRRRQCRTSRVPDQDDLHVPAQRRGWIPVEFKKTWVKVWGYMFGRHIFTEKGYIDYIQKKGSYKSLLTWKGIVQVPAEGTEDFLEALYVENLPLVQSNLERKKKQSASAKAGGPGGRKADPTVEPNAEKKRKAEEDDELHDPSARSSSARADASSGAAFLAPDPPTPKSGARPFLEPESPAATSKAASVAKAQATSSGRPDASWSWNRDHYGSRREWSFWRGAWYYRDEAGGRWIKWNRG